MSSRPRRVGARVLKAVSSSLRLQVLNLLFDQGPLSYTEIMNIMRLNPTRDAGRFAYHLKFLVKTDLIEPDAEAKKYRLTDLGRMLVDVTEAIEEHSFKRRKMLVRTSRLAMEEFDRNKIAEALTKEANVPQDLAQKIARETEGRLLEVKAKYLTAPLIREFVNAILIEKGLEEYRHKLTRLGLPVYDVTQLVKSAGTKPSNVDTIHSAAGNAVIEEYTLLNILPRDIADAHLSGSLHLNNLGAWILKPSEFSHDIRFFFKHGLQFSKPSYLAASTSPPKTLEAAFSTVLTALRMTGTEILGEQLLDYFNIFMAPFARGVEQEEIRKNLKFFISSLNQALTDTGSQSTVSVGLELGIPDFLKDEKLEHRGRKKADTYKDYIEESHLLASLLLETLLEESKTKPLLRPSIVLKIRTHDFQNKEPVSILSLAHRLAAETGLPCFANSTTKDQSHVSYASTGTRFADNWKGDWEIDTVRTGTIDSVVINLPRIAYESDGKISTFQTLLDEQVEMALRAMEIKYQTIKLRGREDLLPFLTNKSNGDQYARFENFTRVISLVGLDEAVQSFIGKPLLRDNKASDFAEQAIKRINENVEGNFRRPESRPVAAMIPCENASRRLAQLDVERYGWAKVHVRGTKEQPYYTDVVEVPVDEKEALDESLEIIGKIQKLTAGGHFNLIQADQEAGSDELMAISKRISSDDKIGLYAFSRSFSYCSRCRKTVSGQPKKCPTCGSIDSLSVYRRTSSEYSSVAD